MCRRHHGVGQRTLRSRRRNCCGENTRLLADVQRKLILLLVPFAPYLACELWEATNKLEELGRPEALFRHPWPEYSLELAKEDEIQYAVQINGKLRGHLTVPAESSKEEVEKAVPADEKIRAAIAGREVVKVIVVLGKLVNIV